MCKHGHRQELLVREIASILGVADFIYTSPPVVKGDSSREASGDGLILVGERGAVIQVKAREPETGALDSPERSRAWIEKKAEKARKQGLGTKRELKRRGDQGDPVTVLPVRALDLKEEKRSRYANFVSQNTEAWPIFVVIDHPQAKGIDLGFDPQVIWLTLEDWKELHWRLRSVSALLSYAERVLADKVHVPLGHECERYSALRDADEQAVVGHSTDVPFLADAFDVDELGSELFRDVLEKVWPDDGIIPWRSADDYRAIVEFLDSVPPTVQAAIGRWFLQKREELQQGQLVPSGLARLGPNQLVYCCSKISDSPSKEEWASEAFNLAMLRHTHAIESGAPAPSKTLCVAALVDDERMRGVLYTFVFLQTSAALEPIPPDIRNYLEWKYGIFDHRLGETKRREFSAGEPCPCLGGQDYGKCHGAKER